MTRHCIHRADDGSVPQPIDGKMDLKGTLAFPNLKWDNWEPVDETGKARPLRLMELTYAKDGSNRLFAVSQYGAIWTFENRPDVRDSHLFLDLRGKVYDWKKPGANEQGLLGLAMSSTVVMMMFFICVDGTPGDTARIRAATPATCGVAIDVPEP